MHTNIHYAVGILIASLAHFLFPMNWLVFLIIISSAIIADLDAFFFKRALDRDHRNFFTHSIYPAGIIILIGVLAEYFWKIHIIWLIGLAYSSHIILDCVDWQTRLFYGKKLYGWALLISEDEKNLGKTRKQLQMESGMDPTSFAIDRYFSDSLVLVIGISISLVSFLVLFVFASEFWYVFIGYFVLLEVYLYQKKKMESKYKQ
ncbi:MAG: hypothetical protein JW776_14290 [Candidatus Lokiarchaeota archaeon]|nr:hypothetical protein [Candidatus Lokiarchaeota archaeon]